VTNGPSKALVALLKRLTGVTVPLHLGLLTDENARNARLQQKMALEREAAREREPDVTEAITQRRSVKHDGKEEMEPKEKKETAPNSCSWKTPLRLTNIAGVGKGCRGVLCAHF
jgi:hypothetical protein